MFVEITCIKQQSVIIYEPVSTHYNVKVALGVFPKNDDWRHLLVVLQNMKKILLSTFWETVSSLSALYFYNLGSHKSLDCLYFDSKGSEKSKLFWSVTLCFKDVQTEILCILKEVWGIKDLSLWSSGRVFRPLKSSLSMGTSS